MQLNSLSDLGTTWYYQHVPLLLVSRYFRVWLLVTGTRHFLKLVQYMFLRHISVCGSGRIAVVSSFDPVCLTGVNMADTWAKAVDECAKLDSILYSFVTDPVSLRPLTEILSEGFWLGSPLHQSGYQCVLHLLH